MVKAGVVYATVTEDFDALTFGSPVMVRHLKARKSPLQEISYEKVLNGLNLTSDEVIVILLFITMTLKSFLLVCLEQGGSHRTENGCKDDRQIAENSKCMGYTKRVLIYVLCGDIN